MANIKSAKKRIRVNQKRAMRNKAFKSELKTVIRKAREGEGVHKDELIKKALSFLDRAVSKGILKKNTAARKKSSVARMGKKAA